MGKIITTEEMYRLPNWFFQKYVHQVGWKVLDPETHVVLDDFTEWYCDRDYDEMIAQFKDMLPYAANTATMQRIMRSREEDAIRRITEIVMA